MSHIRKKIHIKWLLVMYDFIIWAGVNLVLLWLHPSQEEGIGATDMIKWFILGSLCIFISRLLFGIYGYVWRYGGMGTYMRLIIADALGGFISIIILAIVPNIRLRVIMGACILCVNLLAAISIRMIYFFVYRDASKSDLHGKLCRRLLRLAGRLKVNIDTEDVNIKNSEKKPTAIFGAGRIGSALAHDLIANPNSGFKPLCFVEKDSKKIGRTLDDIPIVDEESDILSTFETLGVQTVILAIPDATHENKKRIYERLKNTNIHILTYDYPLAGTGEAGKRNIREFTIEELLSRNTVNLENDRLRSYYRDKVIMVTGGSGSIGSELCRQVAAMEPKQLIILDIAENTTYELQQDLRNKYANKLNLSVEICDITNRDALERTFAYYKPQVLIHAAAHKHVPLMEHNSVECIRNNVFGTLNVVQLSQSYDCEHFIMVSTDKAVNPTNIMGASKRICELIVKNASRMPGNRTIFSATRFGNVLGSAGSVVPIFKKQIAAGGPITLTSKEIIRYFMTIPEASQLVLTSGAIAKNGELFVLDMGRPVRIYDMAENMIRLSGLTPGVDIEIKETGLRPGEKMFEELLINGDNQEKTENELIFIEKDEGIPEDKLTLGLAALQMAVEAGDDDRIKGVVGSVVETYKAAKP